MAGLKFTFLQQSNKLNIVFYSLFLFFHFFLYCHYSVKWVMSHGMVSVYASTLNQWILYLLKLSNAWPIQFGFGCRNQAKFPNLAQRFCFKCKQISLLSMHFDWFGIDLEHQLQNLCVGCELTVRNRQMFNGKMLLFRNENGRLLLCFGAYFIYFGRLA